MKVVIAIGFLALAAVVYSSPTDDGEKYTDRFDGFNIDEVLENRKLLENYVNCCLGKGKCTAAGKEMMSHIDDALATKCAKCTDVQRKGAYKIVGHMINNEPAWWEELKAMYDPNGKYSAEYEEELKTVTKQ